MGGVTSEQEDPHGYTVISSVMRSMGSGVGWARPPLGSLAPATAGARDRSHVATTDAGSMIARVTLEARVHTPGVFGWRVAKFTGGCLVQAADVATSPPEMVLAHNAPQPAGLDSRQHQWGLAFGGLEPRQTITEQQQRQPACCFDDQRDSQSCAQANREQHAARVLTDQGRVIRSLTKLCGERSVVFRSSAQASTVPYSGHPTTGRTICAVGGNDTHSGSLLGERARS